LVGSSFDLMPIEVVVDNELGDGTGRNRFESIPRKAQRLFCTNLSSDGCSVRLRASRRSSHVIHGESWREQHGIGGNVRKLLWCREVMS
jgi:hypothetical protein